MFGNKKTEKKKTFRPIILTTVFVVACMTSLLDEQNPYTINSDTAVNSSIENTATYVTEDGNSEIIALASENSMESISTAEITQYISNTNISMDEIPEYSGNAYVSINDNVPFFTDDEMITEAFEYYSELDSLGRCGVAYANVCVDIMPTEESEKIGSVKPSGWHTVKYDIVNGKYLYNRCHLIGYQLSAENTNTKNLITGTRYLNVEGMLPFENMVADYIKETEHHVLYRVTPMFSGENLLCNGVLMEAKSVEDNGAGILFNVYCYNVQPGITIDYLTGDSSLDDSEVLQANADRDSQNTKNTSEPTTSPSAEPTTEPTTSPSAESTTEPTTSPSAESTVMVHITNTGSKYHRAGCRYLKSDTEVSLESAKALGLTPCGSCNPPQ